MVVLAISSCFWVLKRINFVASSANPLSPFFILRFAMLDRVPAISSFKADQWRKAAEAASAILTSGNDGRNIEDSNKNFISGKLTDLFFFDDLDDESLKNNNSLLRKIDELWKKSPI
ncbi:interactor of constitutive active ROPs 3-like [Dendrobium catenatum]|uniref:Interactor of constitutive active ROPs 3 n=1 Tax=Dendrobium catenatum TaxID=906689 RepID=A0A2I0W2Z1_9ASPA|nr:interactor of constitutive active ROPs 3-like [Dendrobium catenatum]PKU70008.1 Interactor of constitutive active ROPs 3 [Dendrobium catenatum]